MPAPVAITATAAVLPERDLPGCRMSNEQLAELIPLFEGRVPAPGEARAYVCRNYTCKLPAENSTVLKQQLTADE